MPSRSGVSKKRSESNQRPGARLPSLAGALAMLLVTAAISHAQIDIWTGGTGDWNSNGNWSLGVTPDGIYLKNDAQINNGGIAQEKPSGPGIYGTAYNLTLGLNAGDTGSVLADDNVLGVTASVFIGSSGGGALTIQNDGEVDDTNAYVGYQANSTGSVVVNAMKAGSQDPFDAFATWRSTTLYVGTGGAGTLTVLDGGTIYDTDAYIGASSTATGSVTIDGNASQWTNSGSLTIGAGGAATLTIQNSGTVTDLNGYIGTSVPACQVTVDGSGGFTEWSNTGNLTVGNGGNGTLTVRYNATVTDVNGYIAASGLSVGSVNVQGATAKWTNSGSIFIGETGAGSLSVFGGGSVTDVNATIGDAAHSAGEAAVSGTGVSATWTNSGTLTVGNYGFGQLDLENGAVVSSMESAIGQQLNSSGVVTVEGGSTTVWTTSDELQVGAFGTGTLTIQGGAAVKDQSGYMAVFGSASHGSAIVQGPGSQWLTSDILVVGVTGTASLTIRAGGFVQNENAEIGDAQNSGGTVLVTDSPSQWKTNSILFLGYDGSGGLTIQNGAVVSDVNGVLGYDPTATGTATVDGAGSQWTNSTGIFVAYRGSGSLTIQNGGLVSVPTGDGYIGYQTGSGMVTVTGTNSRWTNSGTTYVGYGGTGSLLIAQGGLVLDTDGSVGNFSGGVSTFGSGSVIVDGSTWTNTGTLTIGNVGSGTLFIKNGGQVSDATGYVGVSATGTATLSVASWNNTGNLVVGDANTGTLNITANAVVTDVEGFIGYYAGSNGGVSVTGKNAEWTNTGNVVVAVSGTGTLAIGAAAVVSDVQGNVGYNAKSTGTVTVSGQGAQWTNSETLQIGIVGAGSLTIENGGAVSSAGCYIGEASGATGSITVTDPGSSWNNSGNNLFVGYFGTGTLTIQNGGAVLADETIIGGGATAVGTVTLDGATSTWTNTGPLTVGESGTGTFNLQNGATFQSPTAYLGLDGGSSGTVTVDNATWNITSGLYIGGDATGPQGAGLLRIRNNGIVQSGTVTVWTNGILDFGGGTLTTPQLIFNGGTLRLQPTTVFPNNATVGTNGIIVDSESLTATASGTFSGPGGLTKIGAGSITLSGNSAYAGTTTVSAGSLYVDGSIASPNTSVAPGALLGGQGTIGGNVINQGTVAPGDPRTLTINGNYEQASGGLLKIVIEGTDPADFDHLDVTGTFTLDSGATLEFDFIDGFAPKAGDIFEFLAAGATNPNNSSFAQVLITGLEPGFDYTVAPDTANPGSFEVTALNDGVAAPTPEPGSLGLLSLGLGVNSALKTPQKSAFRQ